MVTVMETLLLRMVMEMERDRVPSRAIAMVTMDRAPPTSQVLVRTGQGVQRITIMEGKRERERGERERKRDKDIIR
jgi:hypothetical protein